MKALQLLKHRFDEIEKMPLKFPFFELMAHRLSAAWSSRRVARRIHQRGVAQKGREGKDAA